MGIPLNAKIKLKVLLFRRISQENFQDFSSSAIAIFLLKIFSFDRLISF